MNRSAMLFCALVMVGLTACEPETTPTPQAQRVDVSPTAEASQTPTTIPPAPTHTLKPGTEIEPILESDNKIYTLAWSPDGKWLAYTIYKEEFVYFLNPESGETCPGPLNGSGAPYLSVYRHYWSWLADSRVVEVDDGAFIYAPCDREAREPISGLESATAIEDESSDWRRFLLATQTGYVLYDSQTHVVTPLHGINPTQASESWSPSGKYVTISGPIDGNTDTATVARLWLLDGTTGAVIDQMEWAPKSIPSIAPIYWTTIWIDDQHYIIDQTSDRGPLLVSVGGEITQIVPELFGIDCTGLDCSIGITPLDTQPNGTYHLILQTYPDASLYHSETGTVETLANFWYDISPDNAWLILRERSEYIFRPIDGDVADGFRIPRQVGREFYYWMWSPDGTRLPILEDGEILLYEIPGGRLIEEIRPSHGKFSLSVAWSPDSKRLAIISKNESRLFIIDLP